MAVEQLVLSSSCPTGKPTMGPGPEAVTRQELRYDQQREQAWGETRTSAAANVNNDLLLM